MKSFIIEDVPDDGAHPDHQPAAHPPGPVAVGRSADDVDKMFADIEAEVGTKGAKRANPAPSAQPLTAPATPAASGAPIKAADDVLPPDVRKVVKLIEALPAVLTREQVQPLLAAMMDAANLNAQTVSLQVEDGRRRAEEGIAAANKEIVRLEADREETLARLTKLMEAARSQCGEAVATQQARIGELTAALNTLAKVGGFVPAPPASEPTERKS